MAFFFDVVSSTFGRPRIRLPVVRDSLSARFALWASATCFVNQAAAAAAAALAFIKSCRWIQSYIYTSHI